DAEAAAGDAAPSRALQGRPGGAPEGGHGAVQANPREPAVRLSAHAASAADLRGPVQRADARHRAAPRSIRALDQRPRGARSSANPGRADPGGWPAGAGDHHGTQHAAAAVDDPTAGRSQPAAHDDDHARGVHVHFDQLPVRVGALLAGQQRPHDGPAVDHAEVGRWRRWEMRSVETEGGSIDEAIEKALEALRVERHQVEIEILENSARGLLGLGSRRARIRATVRASLASKLDGGGVGEGTPEVSRETPSAFVPAPEEKVGRDGVAARAIAIIETILPHLVDSPDVQESRGTADDRGSIRLALSGSDSGMIIGRRGPTPGAPEPLVNRVFFPG